MIDIEGNRTRRDRSTAGRGGRAMTRKLIIAGMLVALLALVILPQNAQARRYRLTPAQKAWYQKILQNYLNYFASVFEKYYGRERAKRYVQRLKKFYERWFDIHLTNPYEDTKTKEQMEAEYNEKLQDLADYLKSIGMSTKQIQEKVQETKAYYEYKYGIKLQLPSMDGKTDKWGLKSYAEDHTKEETYIKDSIRRLGGIITNERPVSTLIGDDYRVKAGFLRGASIFDRKLLFKPPVGYPMRRRPKKIATVTKEVIR